MADKNATSFGMRSLFRVTAFFCLPHQNVVRRTIDVNIDRRIVAPDFPATLQEYIYIK